MRHRTLKIAVAAVVGFVVGTALSQRAMGRSRSALFSARPLRRMAALGYLSGHPSVATVRVLKDYLAWEEHPALRRRAEAIVRRMEANLE